MNPLRVRRGRGTALGRAVRRCGLGAMALLLAAASAASALTLQGRVVDPQGRGVAGALLSDERAVVLSDRQGRFRLQTAPGRVVWVAAPAGWERPGRWWWRAREAAGPLRRLLLRPRNQDGPIALLADPHLFDAGCAPPHYPRSPRMLRRPLRTWRAVAARLKALGPRLTVVAGDLCGNADRGDRSRAAAQMRVAARALAQLPRPARALPGNHDLRYPGGRPEPGLWRRHLGPVRHAYLFSDLAVIMLDNVAASTSTRGRWRSCGALGREALAWLRALLARLPRRLPLLVVTHYALASPLSGSNPLSWRGLVRALDGRGLALRHVDQRTPAWWRVLAGRRLVALVHGHEHAYHRSRLYVRRGVVRLVGLPAVCGGWWRGDRRLGPLSFAPGYVLLHGKGRRVRWRLVEVPPAD